MEVLASGTPPVVLIDKTCELLLVPELLLDIATEDVIWLVFDATSAPDDVTDDGEPAV